MDTFNPQNFLTNKGPELYYFVIIYGSKPGDPLDDSRYGAHQRRTEIALRPRLPRSGMSMAEIEMFARVFTGYQWQDIKHTNFWHCEFCGACCEASLSRFHLLVFSKTNRRE